MVMVVPIVGKPGCPGCKVSSFTGATVVMGWASDITAISFCKPLGGTKPGCRTKLVMGTPGLEMKLNEIDGVLIDGSKQCAAVRIVRELISEPVQDEPDPLVSENTLAENRLTTLGNWF